MKKYLRNLKSWCETQCRGRHAYSIFALATFAGSSFFPVPSDLALAPMLLGHTEQSKRIVVLAVVSSIAGSVFAYLGGYFLFDTVSPLLSAGMIEEIQELETRIAGVGLVSLFIASVLPLPAKVFAIAAGLFKMPFLLFLLAVAIGRSIRFVVLARLILRTVKMSEG